MPRPPSLQAVKHYRTPDYPAGSYVDFNPELLRSAPKRWRGAPVVLGLLATAAVVQGARAGSRAIGSLGSPMPTPIRTEAHARPKPTTPPRPPGRVAPVFVHGEGMGAWGGMIGRRVVLLREEEARKIIEEEAAKVGLHFAHDEAKLRGLEIPLTAKQPSLMLTQPRTRKGELVLDGVDAGHHVAYEYVSLEDFDGWQGAKNTATAERNDVKGAAVLLQRGLAKANPPGSFGVFYDPMAGPSPDALKPDAKRLQAESARQLRLQVRDFLRWLKAQGVI